MSRFPLSSFSITPYSHLSLIMVSRHGALPMKHILIHYSDCRGKTLRAIKFQTFSAPSSPILHSSKVLKLQDMLHTNILSFVYKAFNKLSPSCFHDYFQPNATVHRIGTRQATRGDLFSALKNTTLYILQIIQQLGSKL